jgi:hypothetical protein
MNSFFEPRTAAVFGNGGDNRVQGTLNQANIPQSDQFKIVSNLNVLNCWQGTVLMDDFENSQYQTEKPIVFESNNSQETRGAGRLEFEFHTMGYVDVRKLFLQYDLLSTGNQVYDFVDNVQGQLCLLDNIKRVRIELGTNNFILGNEDVQDLSSMKLQALDGAKTLVEKEIQASLGISRVNTLTIEDQTDLVTDSGYDAYKYIFGSEMFYQTINQTGNPVLHKRNAIPLSMLNPFFKREDTYLPPGLKIKITIDIQHSYTVYYNGYTPGLGNHRTSIGFNKVDSRVSQDFALNSESSPAIIYQYNRLKEMSNKKFIDMWGARPLLYNFFLYGKSFYKLRGNAHVDHIFMINQACPLEIFIRPVYSTDINENGFYNLDNPSRTEFPERYDRVALLGECAPYIMNRIKVFANGVLIKEVNGNMESYKNQYGQSAEEVIANINQDNQIYEIPRQTYSNQAQLNNVFNASAYKVILAPGDIYNIHKYPIDMGTTQLRIMCDVVDPNGNAFNNLFNLEVFYKNPSQLLINDRYTCVSVNWPAISNGSYNFITPTFGSN